MTQSKLAEALVKAQQAMKTPHFDAKANAGKFAYKYATLGQIREATIEALHNNGLAIIQAPDTQDGGFGIRTILLHSSGESIEGFYPIAPNPDPQKIGSAITYAKRYSWASMCGVVADDDDDAQYARQPPEKAQEAQKAPITDGQSQEAGEATARAHQANGAEKEPQKRLTVPEFCAQHIKALDECFSADAVTDLMEEDAKTLAWMKDKHNAQWRDLQQKAQQRRQELQAMERATGPRIDFPEFDNSDGPHDDFADRQEDLES